MKIIKYKSRYQNIPYNIKKNEEIYMNQEINI